MQVAISVSKGCSQGGQQQGGGCARSGLMPGGQWPQQPQSSSSDHSARARRLPAAAGACSLSLSSRLAAGRTLLADLRLPPLPVLDLAAVFSSGLLAAGDLPRPAAAAPLLSTCLSFCSTSSSSSSLLLAATSLSDSDAEASCFFFCAAVAGLAALAGAVPSKSAGQRERNSLSG